MRIPFDQVRDLVFGHARNLANRFSPFLDEARGMGLAIPSYNLDEGIRPFVSAARGERAFPNPMEGVRQVREGLSGIARGAGHIRSHLPTARAFAEEALAYGKARLPELAMAEGRNLIKQATGHEHPMDALSEVGGALYGAAFGSGEESAQGMARLREMGSRAMGTVQNRLRQLPMEEAGRFLQHQAQGNPEVLAGADIMRQGWNRLVGAGDQHILPYVGAAHALGMAGRMMYNQARARRNRQRSV